MDLNELCKKTYCDGLRTYNIDMLIHKLYWDKKYGLNAHLNHQKYIINCISSDKMERYIRYILRKDYNFIFYFLLNENYNKWFNMKNYLYKHIIYPHYIMFIEDFTINIQANKCRNIIQELYLKLSLKKNKHKKKIKYLIYGN